MSNNRQTIYDSDSEDSDIWFHDEMANLDIPLGRDMVVIADLGLWNGRHSGYRLIHNANVKYVLRQAQGDFYKVEWDADTDDVVAEDVHHDGTNYYTFRLAKANVNLDKLCDLIYRGVATQEDIDRYTMPIGKYVRKVYGWKRNAAHKAA